MDIRIIHLPPGTGDEKRKIAAGLADLGQGRDLSHILYLCPTRHLLRAWKQDVIHGTSGDCYIPPRSYTLKKFAGDIANKNGYTIFPEQMRPAAIASLTNCSKGLAQIISDTISELIKHMPGSSPEQIKEAIAATFKALGLPDDALKRAETVMDALNLYVSTLESKGLRDEAAIYELAAGALSDIPQIKTLLLDGFYEVTGAELELIKALISKSERAVLTVPISGPEDDRHYCYSRQIEEHFNVQGITLEQSTDAAKPYHVHTMPSQEEEIEEIARRIKNDFLSGRTRDLKSVLVVFPSLSTYRRPSERIFRRYGIPVNSACLSQPMSRTRPWSDLLGLLSAVADGYPRLDFARVLTSSTFAAIPVEIREAAPSITITAGIVSGRRAWKEALKPLPINEIFAILEPLERLGKNASITQCMEVMKRIFEPLGFAPDTKQMKTLDKVSESLASLDSLGYTGKGLSEFIDALAIALDGESIVDESPGIEIASIYDVRGLEPNVLYIGGLRDGELPSRPEMDFVLPDSVRGRLGLVDLKRHMHLQGFIFKRLAHSAKSSWLSYPRMEGDKLYLPSVLLSGSTESEARTSGAFCTQERQVIESSPTIAERIRQIKASPRGKSSALRVTDAEQYKRCPRRFYIEKVLRLEPPSITEYEVDARDMGTIAHRVMELLIPKERISEGAFISKMNTVLDEVLSVQQLDEYFSRLFRETFKDMAPSLYAHLDKLWDEGYVLMEAEHELDTTTKDGTTLKGKADRIDVKGRTRTIQIVDYKTGSADVSGSGIEKGLSLQLPLYASIMSEKGYETERFGIYSLKDMKMKWVPSSVDKKKEHDAAYFARTAMEHLKDITSGISTGRFTAEPADESTCRGCHERPFCPYHHAGGDA